MVTSKENIQKITSKAYICRSKGSKYQHHKTIVPKSIIQQHQIEEYATLEWIPYGDDYVVKIKQQ